MCGWLKICQGDAFLDAAIPFQNSVLACRYNYLTYFGNPLASETLYVASRNTRLD